MCFAPHQADLDLELALELVALKVDVDFLEKTWQELALASGAAFLAEYLVPLAAQVCCIVALVLGFVVFAVRSEFALVETLLRFQQ